METSDKKTFLRTLPPFNRLSDEALAQAADVLSLSHFSNGQTILNRWENPAYFYLIVSGVVEELDPAGGIGRYRAGDAFDARSLLEGRSQHSFVTRGECSCYLLPATLFLNLVRGNAALREFFDEEIARKLDAFVSVQQQREAASFMVARIGEGAIHPPVFVEPETSIQQATAIMKSQGTTALLVKRGGQAGIFTSRDVRERVLLAGLPESSPIGAIANYELITLEPEDFLINALVVMTQHAIRHVVITRGGEILGLLEQKDLLTHLSGQSHLVAHRIERAASSSELKEAADSIPRVIGSLQGRGVKPRYIARLVTDLNRRIFRRIYEQLAPAELIEKSCLVVMGSEGRGEQLLRTDQDNALILQQEDRTGIVETVTGALTEALVELGYPRCPGNIMASNPFWAKPLAAYKEAIVGWIHQPDADAYMNLAIFYDAAAAAGNEDLLKELKAYLFQLLADHQSTVQHFARAIMAFDTPLGLFNRFVLEKAPRKGALDIKKGGVFPIVHGIRSLALQHQLSQTNTIERIQALSGRGLFEEQFSADLIEAFDFVSMLRLREQLAKSERREPIDNFVNVQRLGKLERHLLRDSLKIVRELKSFISYHFKLSMVS